MSELETRLNDLRRRARQAIWLYGLSWILVVLLCALGGFGLLDWLVHVDLGMVRLGWLVAVLITIGVLCWRLLITPLRQRLSDVELALKIERCYPVLHDSLVSTVQFTQARRDPRIGSPELQQLVVEQTRRKLDQIDFDGVIDTRDVRRAAFWAVGLCLLTSAMAAFRPTEASVALHRLVHPFSGREWPRKTHLTLFDEEWNPLPVAAGATYPLVQGATFSVYVENRTGPLPEDLRLVVKYGDGERQIRRLKPSTVRDREGQIRRLSKLQILAQRGPLRFRVVGGDDDTMPWQTIEVVPAPKLNSLQITLHPPSYTHWPKRTLPAGIGHFDALVGTRVVIRAEASQPLKDVRLHVRNEEPQPLSLSAEGTSFSGEFLIREPGSYSYWFVLTDRKGFRNPHAPRYDLTAVVDRVPLVRLTEPTGHLTATPGSLLLLKVTAEDDLRVKTVSLRYHENTHPVEAAKEILLHRTPTPLPRETQQPDETAVPLNRWELQRSFQWKLPEAAVGTQLRFFVVATDDFNLDARGQPDESGASRHEGRSRTVTVTFVTPAEKTAEVSQRYGSLLEELKRLKKNQTETLRQTEQLLEQLSEREASRTALPRRAGEQDAGVDFVLFKRSAETQRDIFRHLTLGRDSVENKARKLLQTLQNNRLTAPLLQQRLNRIVQELQALRQSTLEHLQWELRKLETAFEDRAAGKQTNTSVSLFRRTSRQQLQRIAERQQTVVETLLDLIEELSEWRRWQDLSAELKDLMQDQQHLQKETQQLKQQTLGKSPSQLTEQHKADLARLGEQQRRLADRVLRFRQSVQNSMDRLEKDARQSKDPKKHQAVREILADVKKLLTRKMLTERMLETAGRIERNLLGQTVQQQKGFLEDLQELQAILDNRPINDLETLIRQQKEAEEQLDSLLQKQQKIHERLRKLQQRPAPSQHASEQELLIKQQEQLRRDIAEAARRLRRLSAHDAGRSLQRATENAEDALQSLQKNSLQQAGDSQQEVLDHLQQARRQLARSRQQLEAALAREAVEKLTDHLQGLVDRQQRVIEGTVRLSEEYQRHGKWSRGRLITLDQLRIEQLRLRDRVQELAEATKSTAVFVLVFAQIGNAMETSAGKLAESARNAEALSSAVQHQRTARKQMLRLLDAWRPRSADSSSPGNNAGDGSAGNEAGLTTPALTAQLKLLKGLQEELRAQTLHLQMQRKAGTPLTPFQKTRVKELGQQQEKLASTLRKLMAEFRIPLPSVTEPAPEKGDDPPKAKEGSKSKTAPSSPDDLTELNSPAALLQQIQQEMQQAADRLQNEQTDKGTTRLQDKAVAGLDRLLKMAEQNPRSLADSSRSASHRKEKTPAKQGKSQQSSDSASSSGNKTQKTANSKKGSTPAKKSSRKKQTDPGVRKPSSLQPAPKLQQAQRHRLIQEVWGHLPEHIKQQLRNVAGEKYLPKYKSLISKYFESLAE